MLIVLLEIPQIEHLVFLRPDNSGYCDTRSIPMLSGNFVKNQMNGKLLSNDAKIPYGVALPPRKVWRQRGISCPTTV